LLWTTVGYGMFYFVRRNYDAVMPVIGRQLGISKSLLGLILTVHGVLYGISKFVNGVLADRANARMFMASALIVCAAINVLFGLSSSVVVFALLWLINGWFQGMGYPPSAIIDALVRAKRAGHQNVDLERVTLAGRGVDPDPLRRDREIHRELEAVLFHSGRLGACDGVLAADIFA
jgi:MFS family permease